MLENLGYFILIGHNSTSGIPHAVLVVCDDNLAQELKETFSNMVNELGLTFVSGEYFSENPRR